MRKKNYPQSAKWHAVADSSGVKTVAFTGSLSQAKAAAQKLLSSGYGAHLMPAAGDESTGWVKHWQQELKNPASLDYARYSPWELRAQEYSDYEAGVMGEPKRPVSQQFRAWHKGKVLLALSKGLTVPSEVLAEYPGLKANPASLVVPGRGWIQESYATGEPEIKPRAAMLRKLGYKVTVFSMGDQITPVGRIKMTMIDIRPGTSGDEYLENVPPAKVERWNPEALKYSDGLTKAEAESLKRKLIREDMKLRELGGQGNYSNVEYRESYRRGHTIGDRGDVVRYAVYVTPKENPARLGSGERFAALESEIAEKGSAYDPRAVTASIGRKKYGVKKMVQLAAAGRKRANPTWRAIKGDQELYLDEEYDVDGFPTGRYVISYQIGAMPPHFYQTFATLKAAKTSEPNLRWKQERRNPEIAEQGSAYDPRAVAASAGRKKYGAKKMAQLAAAGRKRANPTWRAIKGDQELYLDEEYDVDGFPTGRYVISYQIGAMPPHFYQTFATLKAAKTSEPNLRWKQERRNPEDAARELSERFTGLPADKTTIVETLVHVHENLTALGDLVEFKLITLNQKPQDLTVSFKGNLPKLSSNEEPAEYGTQLYIEGGDQELDLDALGFSDPAWHKEKMNLGILYEITYETKKKMDGGKTVAYFHGLGEEDMKKSRNKPKLGIQPTLVYHPPMDEAGEHFPARMEIVGGRYNLLEAERGIVN
jgi:hypothetical protein